MWQLTTAPMYTALQAAIRGVAFGGTVVAGAAPAPYGPGLDLGAEAHYNRPNLIFSRACSDPNREYPRWNENRVYRHLLATAHRGKTNGRTHRNTRRRFRRPRHSIPQKSPATPSKISNWGLILNSTRLRREIADRLDAFGVRRKQDVSTKKY